MYANVHFSPSSVWPPASHLPLRGEAIAASTDTTPHLSNCQCLSLPVTVDWPQTRQMRVKFIDVSTLRITATYQGNSSSLQGFQIYDTNMISSNFCSKIIWQAVIQPWRHGKLYKVSHKITSYLCKEFLRNPGACGEQLLHDIAKYVVPVKPGQQNPRNLRAQSWRSFGYRVSA